MNQAKHLWLLAVVGALLALVSGCSSTSPDKRLLQYLNDKGFGNRYTGNAEDQNYVTIGDTISITDAFNTELNQTARVDIDGTVVLTEVGAVHVAGQTRAELEAFLTQKYSPYYVQLKIDVRIQTAGKVYFIFGEVAGQGPEKTLGRGFAFVRAADGRTVTSAASISGGDNINIQFRDGIVPARAVHGSDPE